jgi:hypothetical protein
MAELIKLQIIITKITERYEEQTNCCSEWISDTYVGETDEDVYVTESSEEDNDNLPLTPIGSPRYVDACDQKISACDLLEPSQIKDNDEPELCGENSGEDNSEDNGEDNDGPELCGENSEDNEHHPARYISWRTTDFDGDNNGIDPEQYLPGVPNRYHPVVRLPVKQREISWDKLNKRICEIVSGTPHRMVKCTYNVPQEEIEALYSLSDKEIGVLWVPLSLCYFYSHLLLKHPKFIEGFLENGFNQNSAECGNADLLNTITKMNFYNIKSLRFGLDETPIKGEERELLLKCIKRNTIVTSNPFGRRDCIKLFLDTYVPFWNKVPGVNITGSLMIRLVDRKVNPCHYTPTYWSDIESGLRYQLEGNQNGGLVVQVCVFFPVSDGSVHTVIMSKKPTERDLLAIKDTTPSNITQPMALVKIKREDTSPRQISRNRRHVYRQEEKKADNYYQFPIVKGTDVDCPVWNDTQVESVAKGIYKVLSELNPGVILEESPRAKGTMYNISMGCVIPVEMSEVVERDNYAMKYLSFYDVEVYGTTKHHVFTHHVGMVRAWASHDPKTGYAKFNMDSTFITSIKRKMSINYYYFAGKKSSPLDVISRYRVRGFEPPFSMNGYYNEIYEYIEKKCKIPIGYVPK